MLYVRYVHFTKGQAYSLETNPPLVREDVTQGLRLQGFSYKKKSLIVSLKGLRHYELIGGKPTVVK
jgi:hypothetical protein